MEGKLTAEVTEAVVLGTRLLTRRISMRLKVERVTAARSRQFCLRSAIIALVFLRFFVIYFPIIYLALTSDTDEM